MNTELKMIGENKIVCEPSTERITSERYFRQAIQVYNKEGKLVDSGFVQINNYSHICENYTDGWEVVRVCSKSKKVFHLFERWEQSGSDFYKTPKFTVTDLVTGKTVGIVEDSYVLTYIKDMITLFGDSCYVVGDLKNDEYSTILLECLNEYSNLNKPPVSPYLKKFERILDCICNLSEKLEIEDLFRNGEIDEERRDMLNSSLVCGYCKKQIIPELTEEQQVRRAELRMKAQAEIAKSFSKKEE